MAGQKKAVRKLPKANNYLSNMGQIHRLIPATYMEQMWQQLN